MRALDHVKLDRLAVNLGDFEEEVEVGPLPLEVVELVLHVDRLVLDDLLAARGTDVDADAAAGAVVRGDLDGQVKAGIFLAGVGVRLVSLGLALQVRQREDLGANGRVRANQAQSPH